MSEYKARGKNGREPRRTRPDGWRMPRTVLVARSERDTAANGPHCAADGGTLSVAARAMPRKYEGTPRRVEGERPASAACLRNSVATGFESRRRERRGRSTAISQNPPKKFKYDDAGNINICGKGKRPKSLVERKRKVESQLYIETFRDFF